MNRTEVIKEIANKTEVAKKDVVEVIKAFEEVVMESLVDGEKVTLTGFISFESVPVPAKDYRNPLDGSTVSKPATNKVKAKLGKTLKECVK